MTHPEPPGVDWDPTGIPVEHAPHLPVGPALTPSGGTPRWRSLAAGAGLVGWVVVMVVLSVATMSFLRPTDGPNPPVPVAFDPASPRDPVPVDPGTEPVAFAAAQVAPSVVAIQTFGGAGSGFVYDADAGLVLTNHHVVEGGGPVTVRFADGTGVKAEVLGSDPEYDIAVLQLERAVKGIPAARLALDTDVVVGQQVIAVGNPFGLSQTVTAGIVSATSRPGPSGEIVVPYIQTDTSVNPGNSGGPLADRNGEVVGVIVAIRSTTGVDAGVAFAIPITLAVQIANQLVAGTPIDVGFLGVIGSGVDDDSPGVVIDDILDGGGAQQAGLRIGDRILAVDGQGVADMPTLMASVAGRPTATALRLTIERDGETREVPVTLGVRPRQAPVN